MKQLLFGFILFFFHMSCFSQEIKAILTDNKKDSIENILTSYYSYPIMSFKFSDGVNQSFFKNNGNVNLSRCLYVYIDYSDTINNIRTGIKVLLIDLDNLNYKEYSEFWYVDYKKAGHKYYPGGMTNNGFGWVTKGTNTRMEKLIYRISKILK